MKTAIVVSINSLRPLLPGLWLLTAILISGCAGSRQQTVFGEAMPHMKTIYEQQFSRPPLDKRTLHTRGINTGAEDLGAHPHSAYQRLKQQFPRLPNPVLLVYVYPHLTPAGTPIPGYTTYFTLYLTDPVALPGDVILPQENP